MLEQKNFVKIEEKTLKNLNEYKIVKPKKRIPDVKDKKIVNEIIKFLGSKKKISNFGGEWEYLNLKKRKNFINALTSTNINELQNIFSNMFQNDASYGIVTPSFQDVKNLNFFKSQILNDIDAAIEFSNLKNINEINTKKYIGNPFGMKFNSKIVMPDTPRHYYFAHNLNKLMSAKKSYSILEIGGGYGGLVRMVANLNKKITYYSIDLLEGCLIQYYFLKKVGLNPRLISNFSDLKKNNINIIPYKKNSKLLEKINNCDFVFNSRSFSEMSFKVLKYYLSLINNKFKPKYIYHENSNYLLFPNSKRHIEILGKNFNINKKKYKLDKFNISPFSGGSGRYREFLYIKKHI